MPQGSILGPLLFPVCIYSLKLDLKCNIKLFADTTSLFTVVEDPTTPANNMSLDLAIIGK